MFALTPLAAAPLGSASTALSYDPYFANVLLGLHCDGPNGSTTFTDVTGRTVTVAGDVQISTAQSRFGGASAYFDGNGDYLSVAGVGEFRTGDFTIDSMVYVSTVPSTTACLFGGQNGHFIFNINADGSIECGHYYVSLICKSAAGAVPFGQWVHVAVSRAGTTLRLFVNGAQVASATNASDISYGGTSPRIGASNYATNYAYFNGYLDDFRITLGVARYTANFAVPTEAFASAAPPLVTHLNGALSAAGSSSVAAAGVTLFASHYTGSGAASVVGDATSFVAANGRFDAAGQGDLSAVSEIIVASVAASFMLPASAQTTFLSEFDPLSVACPAPRPLPTTGRFRICGRAAFRAYNLRARCGSATMAAHARAQFRSRPLATSTFSIANLGTCAWQSQ